jgi:hypothetical protein
MPTSLENTTVSGLFVNPVRNNAVNTTNTVYYNATTKELTYTTSGASDQRVKTNIMEANNRICLSTIESVPLRYFEWKDDFYKTAQRTDKHELGFIAQEIASYFPKSVHITSNEFAEDFHSLDVDQIYKANVGATKQLWAIVQAQQSTIDSLTRMVHM